MFEYGGRAIAHGHVLYRDVWDNKLPGIYLVNALWQTIFGERYALHTVTQACIALVSVVLFAITMRRFKLPAALPAAAILSILLLVVSPLNTTEAYALPLLLAAILVARDDTTPLSGMLLGIASLFWLPSLLMLVPISTLLSRKSRWRAAFATMSVLAVSIATLAYVLGRNALGTLLESWIVYVSTQPASPAHHRFPVLNHIAAAFTAFSNLFVGVVSSGAAPLGAFLGTVLKRPVTQAQRFGLVWTVAMIVAAFGGTRFYSAYFIPSLAAMLFTISAYVHDRVPGQRTSVLSMIAIILAILTARDCAVYWSVVRAQSLRTARIAHAIAPIVAGKLTIQTDYLPELYLALDPVLRNPYEIVAGANAAFIRRLSLPPGIPDLLVNPSNEPRSRVRICVHTASGWSFFALEQSAPRFADCP